MGKVDEVAHDHFFLRETVGEMVGIIIDLAAPFQRADYSQRRSSATASITGARLQSRF